MKRVITERMFRANSSWNEEPWRELPNWFYDIVGKTQDEVKHWSTCDSWCEWVSDDGSLIKEPEQGEY